MRCQHKLNSAHSYSLQTDTNFKVPGLEQDSNVATFTKI